MTKLFHGLKLSGLLSFGPDGIDLPMEKITKSLANRGGYEYFRGPETIR